MAEIDTLEVKIKANAQSAADSLKRLADSLKSVRSALSGTKKESETIGNKLSRNINDLNNAISRINADGINKLNMMSSAIERYSSAVKTIKNYSGSAISVPGLNTTEMRSFEELSERISKYIDQNVTALSKMVSRVDDLNERIKESNDNIKEANEYFGKFFKSISRVAFYRAIRTALKAITDSFSEGLKNAYGYSQVSNTFKRLADTLDRVQSKSSQMKNQLGAFAGELIQVITPAIEYLIEKVRWISERLTEFFAALNGAPTYQRALLVAETWGEATDAVKKYKGQLLGLDELNNLTAGDNKKDSGVDFKTLYEKVDVSEKLAGVGKGWEKVKETIKNSLDDIERIVYGAEIGIGAALFVTGANIPLGLGLLMHGTWKGVQEVFANWDSANTTMREKIASLTEIVGGAVAGIGAVLLFSGANMPLGLGMLISGAAIFGASAVTLKWDKVSNKTQKVFNTLTTIIGGALLVLGTILAVSGAATPLGIGLMAAGAASLGTAAALNWSGLNSKTKKQIVTIAAVASGALLAIGAVLAFSGANIPLGIGLMGAGAAGLITAATLNWDGILKKLKSAWDDIRIWWNNTVVSSVRKAVGEIEETLHIDLNMDGKIGASAIGMLHKSSSGDVHGGSSGSFGSGSTSSKSSGNYSVLGGAFEVIEGSIADKVISFFRGGKRAIGGIPASGSLFYAGEAGAEFVGNIGTTSAVANTGQMTEAIYKAAYMGMSQALKENGGNGFGGFEPASTDDLFIAMRKKASKFNKRTGESAFA